MDMIKTVLNNFRETKKNGGLAESLKHFEGQQYQYATYSKERI